ncbi:MAG TPA: hypothetical protein PKA05_16400 [Roseiflexaceae bacterium]|nr:hypothetical protein [Roseiflexaceae bacterium]
MVSPSTARIAGNIATLLFVVIITLQLLLALGILPVTMAWGGSQTVLTPALQLAHVIAALLLAGFAYVIRRRAGLLVRAHPSRLIKILAWVITGFMFLNTLGNFASSSTAEKLVFGSLTVVLAIASLLVSASKSNQSSPT